MALNKEGELVQFFDNQNGAKLARAGRFVYAKTKSQNGRGKVYKCIVPACQAIVTITEKHKLYDCTRRHKCTHEDTKGNIPLQMRTEQSKARKKSKMTSSFEQLLNGRRKSTKKNTDRTRSEDAMKIPDSNTTETDRNRRHDQKTTMTMAAPRKTTSLETSKFVDNKPVLRKCVSMEADNRSIEIKEPTQGTVEDTKDSKSPNTTPPTATPPKAKNTTEKDKPPKLPPQERKKTSGNNKTMMGNPKTAAMTVTTTTPTNSSGPATAKQMGEFSDCRTAVRPVTTPPECPSPAAKGTVNTPPTALLPVTATDNKK